MSESPRTTDTPSHSDASLFLLSLSFISDLRNPASMVHYNNRNKLKAKPPKTASATPTVARESSSLFPRRVTFEKR